MLNFANSRVTPGMFGSGYLELLAREITTDLRAIASAIQPGDAKTILFGPYRRRASDGTESTSADA